VSELETLYRVQMLDTQVFGLREREENHPLKQELEELAEEEGANRVELERVESLLEESRKKQARMEEEVQRLEEKLSREEGKLYGGKITSPKELRGLQAEVGSIKRQKDAQETELLEEMERQDEIRLQSDDLRSNGDRIRTELEEKTGILDAETAEMRAELEALEKEREELRSQIGDELLELYGELLESKHSVAVVKVIDGVCQGCRVELPGMEYDRFLKSDAVFRCANCGRIMVK
jgi:predicted  nucleic acid-binding Zn-ribbon protein